MAAMQHGRHGFCVTEHATDPPCKSSTTFRGAAFEYPPSADDWEIIKDRIHQMYVIQKQPLKDVRKSLDRLGFRATDRMIKSRLRTWGFVKNAKKEDWGLLAVLHHRRKATGRPNTIFEIHGHRKTVRDLHRFIRNQAKSPEEFLADHLPQWRQTELPDHIRAWTPEPDDDIKANSPLSVADSPADIRSPLPTKPPSIIPDTQGVPMLLAYQAASGPFARPLSPDSSFCSQSQYLTSSDAIKVEGISQMTKSNSHMTYSEPSQIPTPPSMDSEQCHYMDAELEACGTQLLKPQPLVSKIGRTDMQFWSWLTSRHQNANQKHDEADDFHICTRCRQPAFQHFRSIDNFEPVQDTPNRNLLNDCQSKSWHLPVSTRDEGPWLWISRCFLACMCFTRGDAMVGEAALKDAEAHLQRLLEKKDELILTSAILTITILHMHDQDEIAFRIMSSAKKVVDRVIPDVNDPVRATMTYFMHSANESFDKANITSETMHDVYMRLRDAYGVDHPYAITAHCNYSWILKWEYKLDLAEQNLREVYEKSCRKFTENHMQSTIALALWAGCLSPQPDRRQECIELYLRVVAKSEDILGTNHPYRLEAMRRLADQLRADPGRALEVLRLHKDVLWGRAKMLGRKHKYTDGAREQYESDLKRLQKWEANGKPSLEQQQLIDLFTRDPSEAWVNVSLDGETVTTTEPLIEVDDEKGRSKFKMSSSRTPSPASSDDYAAY